MLRCLRVVIIVHESVVGRVARVALLGVVRVRRGHSGVVLLAAVAPAGPASALAARRARVFIGRVGRPVVRIGVVVGGHVGHIWGGRVGRQGGRVGSHGAVLWGGVRQTAGQLATNLQQKHSISDAVEKSRPGMHHTQWRPYLRQHETTLKTTSFQNITLNTEQINSVAIPQDKHSDANNQTLKNIKENH